MRMHQLRKLFVSEVTMQCGMHVLLQDTHVQGFVDDAKYLCLIDKFDHQLGIFCLGSDDGENFRIFLFLLGKVLQFE